MEQQYDDNEQTCVLIHVHAVFRGRERKKWRDAAEQVELQIIKVHGAMCLDTWCICQDFAKEDPTF